VVERFSDTIAVVKRSFYSIEGELYRAGCLIVSMVVSCAWIGGWCIIQCCTYWYRNTANCNPCKLLLPSEPVTAR
jgi:hypothetical protein